MRHARKEATDVHPRRISAERRHLISPMPCQAAAPLATRLRRELSEQVQDAVTLEAAIGRAVRAVKRVRPPRAVGRRDDRLPDDPQSGGGRGRRSPRGRCSAVVPPPGARRQRRNTAVAARRPTDMDRPRERCRSAARGSGRELSCRHHAAHAHRGLEIAVTCDLTYRTIMGTWTWDMTPQRRGPTRGAPRTGFTRGEVEEVPDMPTERPAQGHMAPNGSPEASPRCGCHRPGGCDAL